MTLTPQERTELQRLAEAATPGPWETGRDVYGEGDEVESANWLGYTEFIGTPGEGITELGAVHSPEDAAFIAAANPAAILNLLSLAAEREELRAENDSLRFELHGLDVVRRKDNQYLINQREALESRYSALEENVRKDFQQIDGELNARDTSETGTVEWRIREIARAALGSLPEASDQGVQGVTIHASHAKFHRTCIGDQCFWTNSSTRSYGRRPISSGAGRASS